MNGFAHATLGRWLVALACLAALPLAAAGPQLLKPWDGPVAKATIPGVVSPGTAVRFNSEHMHALAYGEEVELTLPNATTHPYVFELAKRHGGGITTWIGRHKLRGKEYRAIVTTGPGGSFGVFSTPEGDFRLVPGPGHDWLVDMTAEQLHIPITRLENDAVPIPPQAKRLAEPVYAPETMIAIPGVNTVGDPKVTPSPQYVVDIAFVYTNGYAANPNNSGPNLLTRLNFLVDRANVSYADSEIAITLRLVGQMQVTYSDAVSDSTALNAISPGSGSFDAGTFGTVEAFRSSVGADMVAFLRNGSSFGGSGIAWVGAGGGGGTALNASFMYSVTTGCILGCESVFIHEVGHNMGNMHDRSTSSWQAGGTATPPLGAYSYSYGYAFCLSGALSCNPTIPGGCGSQPECSTNVATNFSDIMAYFHGTTERLYKFSNPNVNCAAPGGDLVPRPCGVSEVAGNSANTALSMNNNRAALSALKPTMIGASIQFTAAASSGAEGGNVQFSVSRTGSSTGAVSVNYATASGTATSGSDFTATSGTLNWADGDVANKTIAVPAIADGLTEDSETFTVTLSSPGGANTVLGSPAVATGMIVSAWPPGGTFPAGFATPDGSIAPWSVESDQSFEGSFSLRSANVLALTQGVARNSDVSFTGGFFAGTIAFAYKVSSYQGYGDFVFQIDGVTVHTEPGGESGWKVVTFPLTAGTHTLRWRFANRLDFPCNNVIPPAVGGNNCADRVWIDAVALPPLDPALTPSLNFSQASYSLPESGPNINVQVTRTGPTTGALGVTWTTANGTAVAGSDFGTNGVATQRTGTLSWAAGDGTPKTITVGPSGTVPTITDTAFEADETFTIALSNPTGGAVVGATGTTTVTILDDESVIQFAAAGISVGETGADGSLTLSRTGSLVTTAAVTWTTANGTATAGSDFGTNGLPVQRTGQVVFGPGVDTQVLTVGPTGTIPVLNDALIEGAETFTVTLSAPTGGAQIGAQAAATVTIASDDQGLAMAAAAQGAVEGGGNAVVAVNRVGTPTGAVSVDYATANGTAIAGTHYTATSGTLNWADGDATPKNIVVPLIDDGAVNAARTFAVTLSNPAGATLGTPVTTTVTVADDDNTLQFTSAAASVTEGTPNLTLTVTRTGVITGPASVNWITGDATALAGTDFGAPGNTTPVSGTLNWGAGDSASKTISIPIINDAIVEPTKVFPVVIFGPAGATLGTPDGVVVTLNDDESALSFASATYSVNEGGPNVTVQVTRSGTATNAVSITWTTANGTAVAGQDFGTSGLATQRTGTLSWAAGDSAPKSFTIGPTLGTIPIVNDTALESAEDFTIALSNPTGGAVIGAIGTTTVTIEDNESVIEFLAPAATSVGEASPGNATLNLVRTGYLGAATSVTWTTANGTAVAGQDFGTSGLATQQTGTITFPAGSNVQTLNVGGPPQTPSPKVTVLNDATIEGPETFSVVLSAPTGGSQLGALTTATVTITSEDQGVAMATAAQGVAEGGGSVAVSVQRLGPPTGAVSVNYATANGSATAGTHYTATSGTLNWADGDAAPKVINVPILDDALVNAARTFAVNLSGAVGAAIGTPSSTTVTISDDDNTVQFSAAAASVSESAGNLVLTVTRVGGVAGPASVAWATVDGTALAGTDFGALGNTTPLSGTLNWAAGDGASKTITIPILNDGVVEGAKTFAVGLGVPTGTAVGTPNAVLVTLNDDDAGVVFSSATYSAGEAGGNVTLTVNRIGPTTGTATVTWTTANGTATSGSDFGISGLTAPRTGTLTWFAGDAAPKSIVIPVLNDAASEGDETFTVVLSNPSAGLIIGTPGTATVTIVEDDLPPESTLQFEALKVLVTEGDPSGQAALNVTRVLAPGGSFNAPVTVNYATAAGSAVTPGDFTMRSGTLSWASGDSAPKQITVPITNDAVAEAPEIFAVVLASPSPGAGLGPVPTAIVTILDDDEVFPPDGGIPPGWGIPGGAQGGFSVSNDPGAFEGVLQLRSDTVFDNESAQIEVSGNWLAGTVTFRAKVSSEAAFDALRFYVDGVKVGEWSGTTNNAWQVFSIPVAAGAHTFRWAYEKDGSVTMGQDAGWIDAVVLPPPGP